MLNEANIYLAMGEVDSAYATCLVQQLF
jgi:hypothetical protein